MQKPAEIHAQYIDTRPKLAAALKVLERHSSIGLDTEFISEGRYEPALCLVQLSTPEEIFLIDPIAVSDLGHLWHLLGDPSHEIVALAARQEIKFAAAGTGKPPAKVLDLQIAAGLLGYGYPLSHTNLVHRVLGIRVHGGESFTDWRKRPLSATQLKYAADDVRYLLELRERLLAKAQEMDRTSWVIGECEQFVANVLRDEQRWRVSGSARLSRKQLAVLRELWNWRDRTAQQLNQPASRVLGDSMLVEIARRSPATAEDLFALRGLDRRSLRNAADEIIRAVHTALKVPESELPRIDRHEDPPQVPILAKLLSVAANGLANEYQVDAALLATTADLQDLVRWRIQSNGDDDKPHLLQGWRGDILGKPLLGILEGKSCVRVERITASNPLVFDVCDPKPPKN